MTIKATEKKMQNLKSKYHKKAEEIVDKEIKNLLNKIKKKHKYDSINMISGMGTVAFSVIKHGLIVDETTLDQNSDLNDLNEFIKFMAGEYDTYPSDINV